jgi:A/G-specific adenine glycosylase
MDSRYFSDKVVEWYFRHKRDLPWRDTKDPYRVWLSEIILQQTRVKQGLPYYLDFIKMFPTVRDLASAPEQQVLRLWQGLGYYTRARNLHKCAKVIVSSFDGQFPKSYKKLLELPGIGDYTAAAIASFSFKEPVAVVDGNVFRVLSRVFGIKAEINSPAGKKIFASLAAGLLNKEMPDSHNQALMEFGALNCIPKNPPCSICHLRPHCYAAQEGLQSILPMKLKSKPVRSRYLYYVVVRQKKSLLMRKRTDRDIWHGLYDFFSIERPKPISRDSLLEAIRQAFGKQVPLDEVSISADYKHILTHQVIHARFVLISGKLDFSKDKNLKFYTFERINDLPKPVLITRFLSDHKSFYS